MNLYNYKEKMEIWKECFYRLKYESGTLVFNILLRYYVL